MSQKTKNRHFTTFSKNKYSGQLLQLFSSAMDPLKEITESVGAYKAVQQHFPKLLYDPKTTIIVAGDGIQPRTGSYFWSNCPCPIYSVDPNLRPKLNKLRFVDQRLQLRKGKIGEFTFKVDRAIIVCVHSHAPYCEIIQSLDVKETHMVEIPCCFPYKGVDCVETLEYTDYHIISKLNNVKIYKFLTL